MATKDKSQATRQGQWEENSLPWYEQKMSYCDACGMLIPRKQYVTYVNGIARRYCGIDCALLAGEVRRSATKIRR